MNGEIPVLYQYYQDDVGGEIRNTAKDYKRAFRRLDNKTFKYYQSDMRSFYAAFEKYDFKDKTVMVWGLRGLNCEAMALWKGAKHVYVIEYNKLVCEHSRITVMNHDELAKSGIKTDIAISFSSFEHDGLGRYGDPLNPAGDLEAMQTAHNHLVEGGYMWLGVPQGPDCLIWNGCRIYGEKRLPLLLEGWSVEDVFKQRSLEGMTVGEFSQHLMILRKENRP
jgi:hypothetical protein